MNKTLIIFHLVDDCHSFHRMPMIKAFAKSAINDFDILCVCPAISVGSVFNGRIFNAESVGRISKIDKNLFCYTPIIHEGKAFWSIFKNDNGFYKKYCDKALNCISAERYLNVINWIYRPEQAGIVEAADKSPYIFECYDDYLHVLATGELIPGSSEKEAELIRNSIITFVTSKELFNQKSKISSNVIYAPNGVDFELFYSKDRVCDRKNIGYIGNISDFLNYQLLEEAISLLPEFNFIFVGPVTSKEVKKLRKFENVVFKGKVERSLLPKVLSEFNIALIPFKQNRAMDAVNPLKLWEYLAAGKIVISAPNKEISMYKDIVSFVKDGKGLAERIRQEYVLRNDKKRKEGIELAKMHSLGKLTAEMVGKIKGVL